MGVRCFREIEDMLCQFLNRERREHQVFQALLHLVPGLEDRLMNSGEEKDVMHLAELVCIL